MIGLNWRRLVTLLVFLTLATAGASQVFAERPRCYEILPKRTLAYLRIADIKELGEKFDETALGKIIQQEQIKSLSTQLYQEAENAFTPMADEIGLTISQMLAIPQGEIAIAAVAPSSGQEITAPVLMVDVEGQRANTQKLIELLETQLRESGRTKVTGSERGTKLAIFEDDDPRWTGIVHFQKEGLQVVTTNLEVAEQILAAWDGDEKYPTLEANKDFANVMRYSKGPTDASPQIRWFINPISLAKVSLRGNSGAQMGLGLLPVIGLDGIKALGGSYTMATEEYDTFTEAHMITVEPRTAALAALALTRGDPTPEAWVPKEAASYQTVYWDFERTKTEVATLFNSFRGDGAFETEALSRASEFLGIDVTQDIIEALDGRASLATWVPRPANGMGMVYLGGLRLKADHQFEETLATMMKQVGRDLEQKTYGGSTYYFSPIDEEPAEEPQIRNPFLPGTAQIAVGVVGDYVLVSNQAAALERAIVTRNSKTSLADELDFKLVASKLRRQPGGKTPGWFVFDRPEEGLRMMYDMATSETTRSMLSGAAEDNDFFRTLNNAMNDNPLPPFKELRKFVAPSGSIVTADDKGFHYIGFGLRRK